MAALIDIDHKREEILSLSTSMNVKPSVSTKLPFPALDERLANTLHMHHYAEREQQTCTVKTQTQYDFVAEEPVIPPCDGFAEFRRAVSTSITALYEKRSVARLFLVDMELDKLIGLTIGMVYKVTSDEA
ncbi:hypothetical protein DFH11DRAFT_1545814 [Phellopilus nigrolimitatus]|nr:hypothetical protein DFH11DRAFT_1545814 [Phellopilus nigrolimitatus]